MRSFEELYALATSLKPRGGPAQRVVEWCDDGKATGMAREPDGGYEVFIRGAVLSASSALVRRHLKHDQWADEAMAMFSANRIVLPPDEHYAALSAFLVEELQRNGVAESPARAFSVVEPLIEMALRGTALGEEVVLGLLGELFFLEIMLRNAGAALGRATCLHAWRGYERSTRDFVFDEGNTVEVKLTRGLHSHHRISSISQVDPRCGSDGLPIETLWLLSIGVEASDGAGQEPTTSLPDKIDEIIAHLGTARLAGERNEVQELFLTFVSQYGSGSGSGYDHDAMRGWPAYATRWHVRFARAYRMNEPEVRVLRYADLDQLTHMDPESVTYTLQLPDTLSSGGDPNPASDLDRLAQSFLGN